MLRRFKLPHLIAVGLIGIVGLFSVLVVDSYPFGLLHMIDLIPSLLGHLIFSLFGWLAGYLGGPLMQVLFPFSLFVYLFSSRRRFASSLTLFWTAQSLVDVSFYVKDARTLTYELYGGSDHIWNRILEEFGLLKLDQFMGNFFYLSGVLLFLAALTVGLLTAQKPLEQRA